MADQSSSNLHFVVVGQPSDAQSAGYRRTVRSHVTKTQHRRAREATTTKLPYEFVEGSDGRRRKKRSAKGNTESNTSSSSTTPSASTDREENAVEELSSQHAVRQELTRRTTAASLQTSGASGMFSTGAMSLRTIALDDADNDVGMVLSSLRCNVTTVWTLYERHMISQTETWLAQNPEMRDTDHAACLLSFLWQDSTLLNVAMLSGTRKLLDTRGHALHPSELYHLTHLRGRIIQRINTAMTDPVRRISDQMICVVLFFALYELRYTSAGAYKAHMMGLVHMINMRGGIHEIVHYIASMIIFLDRMCSRMIGGEPYANKMRERTTPDMPRITEAP
ncbi:hypothetical protein CKM354_001169700 [Cercospora kikuchii]|uniref:Uncharacterized protein n=1 Tax=Cercospora kikuchii TaxID=84275 RepID=A0A9P3FLC1_9PEZI|nr:uncharacterized protein CKM354_001169700 [Cercospora kikuchii]GIZ48645.1 hypothetical protein CKM354_001169700 [Cercospora kikuchii]